MINTMNEANDVGIAPEGGKSLLSSLLTNNNEDKSNASFLGNRNLLIAQGTFIDCVLRTKLISTVAGMSSCVISKNIYSDNGKVVLVERGSEVIGQYQTTLQQGQKRIFVLWNRIKTPNGVVIDLASPGTDSLGASGLPGWVDTHFWERFGSALLFSVVDDLAQAAVNQSNNSDNQTINFGNTAEASGEVATEIIKSTIDIKPTLYKNQGERINIFVARDLDFSGVYDVRAK
jgi:type IV secretion system protein VirB10